MSKQSDTKIASPMDDLYNSAPGGSGAVKGDRYATMTKEVGSEGAKLGKPKPAYDARKFAYDVLDARKSPNVNWHVTKDDRMNAQEAGEKLKHIHTLYGIERENPSVLHSFFKAMCFCHTINSGSVLQPQRSKILIRGTEFPMAPMIVYLGPDIRRFFRAFADEVMEINKEVLNGYDPYDLVSVEKHAWIMEVAMDRGLMRYPYLAHDSSDKCILTPAERAAVSNSKMSVFKSIINAPDRFDSNARMTTSDDYDSTNLMTVPNKSTGHH